MNREAWRAAVHGVAKRQTWLSDWTELIEYTAAAAAAAKSLQSCLTLCDPIDGSPPGSLGFSRQEHWSGLPFPSPMYESEKWKWSRSVVSDLATPWTAAYQAPLSMDFPGKSTGVGCHCLLQLNTLKEPIWEKTSSLQNRYMFMYTKTRFLYLKQTQHRKSTLLQ